MNEQVTLSKSSFIRGKQCVKSMYLNIFQKQLKDKVDENKFLRGHEVGKLAQQLFPGGIDCGIDMTKSKTKSLDLTNKNISEGATIIYEGAFEYNGLLSICDIMVKNGDKWKIYEVKSSNNFHDYYYNDTGFQYYVMNNAGINIEDFFIVQLNREYIRKGELELNELFKIESVLEKILSIQDDIKHYASLYQFILSQNSIPELSIGPQCTGEPANPCEFMGHCWKNIPDVSVFNIGYLGKKAFDLYSKGIIKMKDIPSDYLNENQKIEVESYINNRQYIHYESIKEFLSKFNYPLYFMDFESIQFAVPEYDNSRPWQQIVFQYSLYYIETKESEPEHFEYLAESNGDPRLEFIKRLLKDTERTGTILVYNQSFEKRRLNELAIDFPDYTEQLLERSSRIIDLAEPFRNKYYYKPEMLGKYSLKSVLPAIAPELSYGNLVIQDGSMAGEEFLRLREISDMIEINKVRKDLLEYCKRDTYGMIVLLSELESIVNG
jgi:hypothetical protein